MKQFLLNVFFICLAAIPASAQVIMDYDNPNTYILAGIEVEGAEYSDASAIISLSGLVINEPITIPGMQITDVLKRLWKENIFSDVEIIADKTVGNKVWVKIKVVERPRISQFSFQGISKSQADDLRENINFIRGTILTESKKQSAERIIRNFYVEKGFYGVKAEITEEPDKILKNGVVVNIKVDKGPKMKIAEIALNGNESFDDRKVNRKLKKFHQKSWLYFWQISKYVPKTFREAKTELTAAYSDEGYRDFQILRDTVYILDDKNVKVEIDLYEGTQYFHRDIRWSGNLKYNSEQLDQVLGVSSGDVYSRNKLDERLFGDPNGSDVSSLYLDNGYLFFNLVPVEVLVEGDSIDLEMRVQEGPPATNRSILISGNTKTSDNVIRRDIRTNPGNIFRRSEIIRSQREILALNYFDQEKLGVVPSPDIQSGTVDIAYTVEERPSDQLQLQGGWGQRVRDTDGNVLFGGFVGTVQLAFNNFATRRMFDQGAWRPVPSGDGQQVSLAIQMNGATYKNFSFTFLEPWLGGKKPNSFGFSASYFVTQPRAFSGAILYRTRILNVSADLGQRLKFPDDYFTARTSLGYKYYDILNPTFFNGFQNEDEAFINIITIRQSLDRSSVDAPIYPRSGAAISLSVEATPPYSLFDGRDDYSDLSAQEKFNFLEYHKWRFSSDWYYRIVGDLVLRTNIQAGFLGAYNRQLGVSPFERYYLGGSGIAGFGLAGLDGREIIPLRGYPNLSIDNRENTPDGVATSQGIGYPIYNRFAIELRYPITLNQSAPVWVQAFLEAGNGFNSYREYNPFRLRRAAGAGVRVMLPMVGLLGLDWAYGFDATSRDQASQFHFIIGQNF
ncbi:MAG: outer membrane protein assembly factor BamA [Bacteroidota bacterium]